MPTKQMSVSLGGAREANIRIDFGAGDLNIGSLEAGTEGELARGTFEYDEGWVEPQYIVAAAGTTASLTISQKSKGGFSLPSPGRDRFNRWDLRFHPHVPTSLEIHSGASKTVADLSALRLTDLRVETGASDLSLTFPANAGTTRAVVKGGAASFRLTIPQGVAARIAVSASLANVDMDSRFTRAHGYYITQGYDAASNKLDMSIEVGASSVTVR